VDVHDEGCEHGRGDVAKAADSVQVVGLRQRAIGGNQQVFQAFLPRAGIAELAHLLADQFGGHALRQRRYRGAGILQQRRDVLVGQVGNGGQVGGRGSRQQRCRGIAVDQFEHPAGRQLLGEQGQLGEGQGEQVVELVAQARAVANDGLEAAGDLTQAAEFE
jgi:hypothetical protein